MKLSIVILNYNTSNLLRLCLQNLLELDLNFDYEVIVVDNASRDGSVEMMREKFPNIKLIAEKTNWGHAKGNNLGIKEAKGDYVLILNTDIIFKNSEDFNKIISYLDQHPEIGMLGPKLLNGDLSIQNSCFRPYGTFTPIYRRTPLGKLSFAKKDLQNHLMWDFDHKENREVEWLLGACMFILKDFLDKFGGLEEKFFLYFADYELCDRIRAQGLKVYYYADVNSIIHYHNRASAKGSIWGGLGSLFNYVTRIHIKDWLTYLKLNKK